jgi:polysaccharide biosynthesis protein PslG
LNRAVRTLVVALALSASLFTAASADAVVPKDFFGVVSEDVLAGDAAYRDTTLTQQKAIGIGLIRQTFHWKDIETSPGVYNWATYDAYMAATASHGIGVLPILFEPPAFRAPGGARGTYPPTNPADIGAFGAAVARRYGPNGTFWTENPAVPKLPITAYQIWNEPNLRAYWPGGQNATAYARLLKAASAGIRAADPNAEIVTAGLPDSKLSKPLDVYAYVQALLAKKGAKSFNTLALNPYSKNKKDLIAKLTRFRQILNANGGKKIGIWITELGWSDSGPASLFRAGSNGQAAQISSVYPALVSARAKLKLRGVVYYAWRDGAPYAPLFKDFWGLHTGLLSLTGGTKPAYQAFQNVVASLH